MDVNLILARKSRKNKLFPLPGSVTVIGRRQECELCIPLMVVSRKHCEFNQDQGKLVLRDLGSRNGTFVNGRRIDESVVSPGDQIQVGPITFVAQINGEPASDSAIMRLPEHLVSQTTGEKIPSESGDFVGLNDLDEVDTIQGHNAMEILDAFKDKYDNNNT